MSKEPIGSVAEEAAKLFALLQQTTTDARTTDAPRSAHAEHGEQASNAADSRPRNGRPSGTPRRAPGEHGGDGQEPGATASSRPRSGRASAPRRADGADARAGEEQGGAAGQQAGARGAKQASGAAGQHPRTRAGEGPDDARVGEGSADSAYSDAAAGGAVGCEHAEAGPVECQWCPVCQLISRVRSTSPETIEQLSMAAAAVLGSVRSLLEAAAEAARQAKADAEARVAEQARSAEQSRSAAHEPEPPARSRVDRIDVSEDPEPWD